MHMPPGWLYYNQAFQQQAAMDPLLHWNTINPGLQAATILDQSPSQGFFCTQCRGVDHHYSPQCAHSLLYHPAGKAYTRNSPAYMHIWNKSDCTLPGQCTFSHVYVTCQLAHKAWDCSKTPITSWHRQGRHLCSALSKVLPHI